MGFLFSSESVSCGHPDKLADQISDSIVDHCLREDREAKVAAETLVTKNIIAIGGEISSTCELNYTDIVYEVLKDAAILQDAQQMPVVLTTIKKQSPEIAWAASKGASDQAVVFGYATDETTEYMPLPIQLAHTLIKNLKIARDTQKYPFLLADAKTLITCQYDDKNTPQRVHNVVFSCQHTEEAPLKDVQDALYYLICESIPEAYIDLRTQFFLNPAGTFIHGSLIADTGLTGRKQASDTYGGYAKDGGGAYSGKDPTKIDRSAAYMARYVAKNIVASHLAKRCEVQLAYAIGIDEPIAIDINTFGTSALTKDELIQVCIQTFDFSAHKIVENLCLKRPIYRKTSVYGHFGRNDPDFTWEKIEKKEELKEKASKFL